MLSTLPGLGGFFGAGRRGPPLFLENEMEYESSVMTQQVTIVLEPPALRFALPEPEVVGLLRPIRRRRHSAQMRYAGATSNKNRRKYAASPRLIVDGLAVRMLSPEEIAEWHKRLGRIMSHETEVRREPL
jgi:hypothetical protein